MDLHSATWISADAYRWRPDARRFENWETNYATKIGLAEAIDYALGWGLEAIRDRTFALAARLREALGRVGGVKVHDLGRVKSGIVTFAVDGRDAVDVGQALLARRMNTSIARLEYSRLDMEARGLERLVRALVHYYNTEDEVERFAAAVAALR